jgi:hypothetical protein
MEAISSSEISDCMGLHDEMSKKMVTFIFNSLKIFNPLITKLDFSKIGNTASRRVGGWAQSFLRDGVEHTTTQRQNLF